MKMPSLLLLGSASVFLVACDTDINVPASERESSTTIVTPAAEDKKEVENNTTIVNPPAKEETKEVESNTTIVNPGNSSSSTTTESSSTTTTTESN